MPKHVRQGGVTRGESAEPGPDEQRSLALAALAASLDPIIVIDAQGTVRLASESVERVLGWSARELVGQNAALFIPVPDRAAHERALDAVRRSGRNLVLRTRELSALRRDGTAIRVELSISSFDGGRMFCGILRDISDRKRTEDEREHHTQELEDLVRERTEELERSHQKLRITDRLAAIGTLAAGLGHDMNNVLLPVRAHLNAIMAAEAGDAAREHGAAIRKSLAYLQQLADGLHFLALDPERQSPLGATELAPWWDQTGALLSKSLPAHVTLNASFPAQLPAVAMAPHQLTQTVLNLLVNAGEAIPPDRQGRVSLWAKEEADGARVRIGVSDNGRGMTDETRRRATEMFFTTKSRGMGTGLGLPLVHRVVTRAGGSIDLESTPGLGTTITLELPAARSPERARAGAGVQATLSISDPRSLALIAQLLQSAGAEVRVADEPGAANLWALEPGRRSPEEVEAWTASGGGRIPVLVGPPPPHEAAAWEAIGGVIIADQNDLDSVRGSLGRALAGP